jgi:2-dehydropantoate 2-reductase
VRVAVFGAGAIGAFYGARLAGGGAEVSLIARGERLAALRERGLTIVEPERTTEHRLPATDDPAEIGPVDLVLFCVKSYDTDAAAPRLQPLLGDGTAVLSLQNGVDNEERIAAVIGWHHVLGGAAYIVAGMKEPGVLVASGPRAMVIGEWEGGEPSERVRAVLEACARGAVDAKAAPDVQVAKWQKFVFLAAFSAMTAGVRLRGGDVVAAPAAAEMMRALMAEVWAVGRTAGVKLPDDEVERQFGYAMALDPGATSSLYRDLVAGKRMEVDALQGTVVRLGRDLGVPTPWMSAAYAILEPWARRNAQPPAERTAIP